MSGPNLAAVTDTTAVGLGLPPLTGPFVLAALAYGAAAIVLTALLRPDPLLHARAQQSADASDPDHEPDIARGTAIATDPAISAAEAPPTPRAKGSRAVVAGATTMVVTQLVMVAIMTMTPVHILEHGHGVAAAGLIIAIHIAAIYLPAPVSGWFVDCYGTTAAAVLAGAVLLAAGLTAALAPGTSLVTLAVALALLGAGWNLGLLSGTTALAGALDPATRPEPRAGSTSRSPSAVRPAGSARVSWSPPAATLPLPSPVGFSASPPSPPPPSLNDAALPLPQPVPDGSFFR